MPETNIVAFALALNPEPWAMGTVSVVGPKGRKFPKVSPNKTLKAYQDAIREELALQGAVILPGMHSLRFTFSRQLVAYMTGSGRTSTRNHADTSNMGKGTEDALQGVLLDNDRTVIAVESRMNGPQERHTMPWVVIEMRHSIEGYAPRDTAIYDYRIHHDRFTFEGQAAWEEMAARELGPQLIVGNELE